MTSAYINQFNQPLPDSVLKPFSNVHCCDVLASCGTPEESSNPRGRKCTIHKLKRSDKTIFDNLRYLLSRRSARGLISMNEPLINGSLSFLITMMDYGRYDIRIVAERRAATAHSSLSRALASVRSPKRPRIHRDKGHSA